MGQRGNNRGGAAHFLDHVPAARLREMGTRLRTVRAPRGRVLISGGSRSSDVFILADGKARIVIYSQNGREVSVRDIGPGDVFGELSALDGGPRSASIVALSEVRMLVMTREDFVSCVEMVPSAAMWLARRLGREVRRLTEKVFELSALNTQARLHCELLRLARLSGSGLVLDPAPTQAEIANRIGTHREAVTREMRTLVGDGVIRVQRRRLVFLDTAALEARVADAVGDMSVVVGS